MTSHQLWSAWTDGISIQHFFKDNFPVFRPTCHDTRLLSENWTENKSQKSSQDVRVFSNFSYLTSDCYNHRNRKNKPYTFNILMCFLLLSWKDSYVYINIVRPVIDWWGFTDSHWWTICTSSWLVTRRTFRSLNFFLCKFLLMRSSDPISHAFLIKKIEKRLVWFFSVLIMSGLIIFFVLPVFS